ncbi:hypothetical protein LSH36_214g04021 [Paralvinella palmiformis]|uniref:Uncharacterized protein n=1 Tax=Paralvinella palmiformis TaxID=53620 RepID=A0AAD9N5Q2_9ANNE|nr:hypothetical protein LSH36_214g04021 [Paralvinella palmiformis]
MSSYRHHTSCMRMDTLSAVLRDVVVIFVTLLVVLRPVRKPSDVITVVLDTAVVKVLDLDEKQHVLTTNGWIYHEWHDFQLEWNPQDYGGLKRIRIPVERLWVPDIVLFNKLVVLLRVGSRYPTVKGFDLAILFPWEVIPRHADESYKYVVDKLAIVINTGKVIWIPHARLRSYCNLDLSRFPFDTQVCSLVFGSWSYDVRAVNVTLRNNSKVEYMIDSKEWEINSVLSKRYQWSYHDNEMYAGIISAIKMRRTSAFYHYVFIMPTILFAHGHCSRVYDDINDARKPYADRIGYCSCCSLSFICLSSAAYLAYILVMVTVNLFFAILAINMCMRDPKYSKVPGWMRWIFIMKLSKVVCIAAEPYTAVPADLAFEENTAERELLDLNNGTSEQHRSNADSKPAMERTLEDIRRYLRLVAARTVVNPQLNHRQLVSQEWHQVTRVIDRLLFVSFLLLTMVITIAMYAHY